MPLPGLDPDDPPRFLRACPQHGCGLVPGPGYDALRCPRGHPARAWHVLDSVTGELVAAATRHAILLPEDSPVPFGVFNACDERQAAYSASGRRPAA